MPVAIQLHELNDEQTSASVGSLFKELGLSLNRQREMLELIVSICRRDDISPSQLLTADEICRIRRDEDLDRRKKTQHMREYLRRRRYPTILAFEQRFDEIVRRIGFSKGTSLIPPPYFESPVFSLKIEFQNTQELTEKIIEIQNIIKTEILSGLWNELGD